MIPGALRISIPPTLALKGHPPKYSQFGLLFGSYCHRPVTNRRGTPMKHKNLGACEDKVLSILALNKLGSERRKTLNRVRKKLNRAKQCERITREEVFEIVRELAEALVESDGSME